MKTIQSTIQSSIYVDLLVTLSLTLMSSLWGLTSLPQFVGFSYLSGRLVGPRTGGFTKNKITHLTCVSARVSSNTRISFRNLCFFPSLTLTILTGRMRAFTGAHSSNID